MIIKIIFWTSLVFILYTYLFYGIFLYIINSIFKKNKENKLLDSTLKHVSILVACYNEEDFVEEKINNLLRIRYPEEKLDIVFITDGSNDNTQLIIQNHQLSNNRIKHYHSLERKGKQHAINRVIPFITSDIIVFNDCNTVINSDSIEWMVRHFSDPKVGVVTGEKKILVDHSDSAVSAGEGIYWKYESFLKKMNSQFYSTIGSPGELFAIRKELYSQVPESISIEDFYLSMNIVLKGYRNIYEPKAVASEYSSESLKDEFIRKRRIAAGAYNTAFTLREIYALKHLKLLFQYFSHRIMRWIVAPVSLILVLLSNILLKGEQPYDSFLMLQVLFYGMAALGFVIRNLKLQFKLVHLPFYFVFMNAALFAGFIDFLKRRDSVVWQKVNRRIK